MDGSIPHEDWQAAHDLMVRYALCQDTADLDGFIALFHPDAMWERPVSAVPVIGREAVVANAQALFSGRAPTFVCQHIVTNILIETDETGCLKCQAYSLAYTGTRGDDGAVPPMPQMPAGILRYEGTARRLSGKWAFSHFKATRIFRPHRP